MRRPAVRSLLVATAALAIFAVVPVSASDGRIEINEDCAAVGCFTGDGAGYPVTLIGGSYILTSSLNATLQSGTAITITSSSTLDLNGFSAFGNNPGGTIEINSDGVEIRSGTILGVNVFALTASNRSHLRLIDLRLHGGLLFTGGSDVLIRDSHVTGGGGLVASGQKVAVVRCTVTNAIPGAGPGEGDGIQVGQRSLVVDSTATDNAGDGIEIGLASVVRSNVVSMNTGLGVNLASDTLVIGNAVVGNTGGNIEACATCTIVDNEAP